MLNSLVCCRNQKAVSPKSSIFSALSLLLVTRRNAESGLSSFEPELTVVEEEGVLALVLVRAQVHGEADRVYTVAFGNHSFGSGGSLN